MKNGKNESLGKFQDLLKTLFQFEASDLDFGIYRVLNYKRDLIEKFINDDLARKVDEAFSKYQEKISEKINEEFEQKKQEVIKTLGEDALTTTGDIKEQFKDFPVAKEYRRLKENKDEIRTIDDIKLQVYNDLYEFFSRYYEDGDFVPHYRYSIKNHKYAIPYNGEEVKLYWANCYGDLKKLDRELPDQDKFEAKHVFFFNDTQQWVDKMFNEIFNELNNQGGERQ